MSLSTFIKLVGKAFRYSVNRPIQRFNVYNRSKKHLGPDAKYFKPAPRAIGPMSQTSSPIQYPHLTDGSRHLEEISREPVASLPKSFSETEQDDSLVKEATPKLDVKKTVVMVGNIDESTNEAAPKRSMPKLTNLGRRDPADIWEIDKTPPGRLSLHMFQELMLNRLGEGEEFTPKIIAERYKIREEYAESLIKYLKQVRIVVSPRMGKLLDYVGKDNPAYLSTKHLVYHVDKSLRTDNDKIYDKMYLPTDKLEPEIRELIDQGGIIPATQQFGEVAKVQRLIKRPAPLRLAPVNVPKEQSSQKSAVQQQRRLSSAKHSSDSGDVT